ncbi:flagellin [Oleiphilus sp. HI0071]|uniref:flagellin N-terminal helical domain-containing protein n=1 Tax=unclassified Oleiphilus TaxID=2631174 RepID=UPI0007C20038|nr:MULTISPECIES: flagellin [unclassified Oleiphilus]KZY74799.1 flagellin [Oleiphilus sp. HI0065]KZY87080.1 flagellin [Oleiphilus sp. HI0071]KZY91248.1 flagellin [Oleiphilus sp. HI0073]KZZ42271.1 flagellin [Oleiphilus sp. HI0118]KZZ60282.1 flagellin [Oleiphilus sp. HI0122]KZZ75174.1 flagellin [Oleiphilus sp. HI0130]KZZ82076.1 flagellin [Oleiphilus sp. HI0133]
MPQIINTNIASLNAQRNLDKSQSAQDTALQRLSSGLRINSAKDDAAGLSIASRLDTQVQGLSVASRNAGDGVSLAQIAEGSIESITTNLQRLRELAVQSANGTNGDSERASLNAEAQQLIEEIDRTASNASFNGVKLLDGSFQNKNFQVGANVGDEVNISLSSVGTETLGATESSGISSTADQTALTGTASTALVAGDIVINGVAIGASDGAVDTQSTGYASSGAIAKADAINAVSDQTGVVATVLANSAEGTDVADGAGAVAATDIDINGVTISLSKSASGDAFNDLSGVAESINDKAGATGVTATVVASDAGARIDLVAEDGRNITIVGAAAGTLGLATGLGTSGGAATTGNTYIGNYSLSSLDGSDINITSNTGDIDNAGFEAGTFSGATAGAIGNTREALTGAGTLTPLVAGDLTINGVVVGATRASDDTASTSDEDGSAISIAAAINRVADKTGVTAEAAPNTKYSSAVTQGTDLAITLNGVAIAATSTGTLASEDVALYVDAINAETGQTGVRAEVLDDDQYTLIADDGRNIVITGQSAAEGLGATDLVYAGSVVLSSGGEFTLGTSTGDIENAGFTVGTFGASESGTLLKDVDISTEAGAKAAITAADNALGQVNSVRASLGSIQSRFENVITANASTIEAFSASSSRIKDADFAAETAALSRAQVLQQAGISVLAQANARPQQVLSLLQ